jgi:hypothetical protein
MTRFHTGVQWGLKSRVFLLNHSLEHTKDMNFYQLAFCFANIVLSIAINDFLARKLSVNRKLSLILFLWHTMFCFIYWVYVATNLADANNYYELSLLRNYDWTPGTSFVISFTALITNFLNFNKLNTFLVYNLFGTSGLLLLAHILLAHFRVEGLFFKRVFVIMLFMPTLSFWSCAIGKDSPAFLSGCLASFAFLDFDKRKHLFLLAIIILFLVRPHIATMMLLAFFLSILLTASTNKASKVLFIFITVVISYSLFPFISQYLGLGDILSLDSTSEYVVKRQSYNLEGSSSLDISEMPLPLQIFTYLFRPLFFDVTNLMGFVVSIDNLFLLLLSISYIPKSFILLFKERLLSVYFNAVYFLVGTIAMATTTSNLGIAIRQKTMILPCMIFLIVIGINNSFQKRRLLLPQPPLY